MFPVGRDYYIDNDNLQWILVKKSNPEDSPKKKKEEDEESEGLTKETFKNIGYYPTLEQLFNSLYDKQLRAKEYRSIEELANSVKETKKFIEDIIKNFDRHLLNDSKIKGVKLPNGKN